jgi:arylsulfatase A-like enzyme
MSDYEFGKLMLPGIQKGVVTEELIQNADFVPTGFELAGVKLPKVVGAETYPSRK